MRVSLTSDIQPLIQACQEGQRDARASLYRQFYNYAMSICLRYSKDREEAKEIVNDGFLKIFAKLDKYDHRKSFQGWLRRIMINASIDFYRRNQKHYHQADLEAAKHMGVEAHGLSSLTQQEIMDAVQKLPPSYRMVFNLFVVEGYKHEEIAEELGISIGTSKSNLAKARAKLKVSLAHHYANNLNYHG
ncbi:MAG: sigma-70 family RNA polymerase sigma factor [Bacteroidota bacterium]